MFSTIARKIFGTKGERELKQIQPLVAVINAFEAHMQSLSDVQLSAKTMEFRERLNKGESLDDLLPEAFAVVREASKRVLNMRHYDVQMIGGIVLHRGQIAEMKTGEGKTLVATLPVYLNALTGKGVHVVTVNDYLARRDAEWMGRLYKFLGLSVGVILHGLNDTERQWAYNADVTYGTNNEFGFDYLRDNMKYDPKNFVQRPLYHGIVDEVDSILIDEARTPLIISGPAEQSTELYRTINALIPFLKKETHYTIDEKARSAMLTDEGVAEVERRLKIDNLYEPYNISYLHHVNQGLRAHALYTVDVDYVVKDGKVEIVDEFTGRLMPGRRWGDGLHQAVEAKEGVRIENENQTLATITYQNFFRMYEKLSGMTGTADTEAAEFAKIYNLDVVVIPPNKINQRKDMSDVIYKTEIAKFHAVVEEIRQRHATGQPVLVGTISIEKSERVSNLLNKFGVKHHVLNAKQHQKEAEIIAQAGRKGAVTISTNMAGRGTDILLGGNPEFLAKAKVGPEGTPEQYAAALLEFQKQCEQEKQLVLVVGGLHIMGTERHESRRIDNQLRGRAGRQGDPGSSQFFLSLEDDLMRIFGGERIANIMEKMGMKEEDEIQHPWLTRAIANAQAKVESHHFQIRKNVLEYDDVMNHQRKSVYGQRRQILQSENNHELVLDMIDQVLTRVMDSSVPEKFERGFDQTLLEERIHESFNCPMSLSEMLSRVSARDDLGKILFEKLLQHYAEREQLNQPQIMRQLERILLLQTLDTLWKEHLLQMDHLREGVSLRGYGQKDPLLEYKKEGFKLFSLMMDRFAEEVVNKLFRVQVSNEASLAKTEEASHVMNPASAIDSQMAASGGSASGGQAFARSSAAFSQPASAGVAQVGRNDPCPCGSGLKYKKCHGK